MTVADPRFSKGVEIAEVLGDAAPQNLWGVFCNARF